MRYSQLNGIIAKIKPVSIVEIGTWNGDRAEQMITEARRHNPVVYYDGYDLFEDASNETDSQELNVKKHFGYNQVNFRLNEFAQKLGGVHISLHRGNTRETLKGKRLIADFVWLDGGHSVDTIKSDYFAVQDSKCIAFDDYYVPENGHPDVKQFGCNVIVDQLKCDILPDADPVSGGGKVRMAVFYNESSD